MNRILKLYTKLSRLTLGGVILIIAAFINIFIPLQVKNILENTEMYTEVYKLAGIILLATILLSIGNYIISKSGEESVMRLRHKTTNHLVDLPVEFFENEKSGSLTHKVMESLNEIRDFISKTIPNFISSLIIIVGSITVLIILDWKLTLVLVLSLIILILSLSILSNMSNKYTKILKMNNGELNGKLSEFLQQIRLIKFTNAQNFVRGKLSKEIKDNYKHSLKLSFIDSLLQPLVMLFLIVVIIGIFTYGAFRIKNGSLEVSVLIAFLIYLFQLLTPFSQVGQFFNQFAKTKVSMDFIENINSVTSETDIETKEANIREISTPKYLSIENVYFSYGDKEVLHGISLEARKGEKIALVGPSGSGKSTILRLIEQLYHEYDGEIKLNSLNIKSFGIKKWRNLLSVVSQDTALLSVSIRENMTLGVGFKEDNDLLISLEKASLLNDVNDLENGLDTEIGENGIKLSGGQQQRLQIARALLKDSPIILMDEATSNLDSETERIITDSMNELMNDKISIVVAHRLSTIVDADRIYFVEKGKVTGVGNHRYLMNNHSKYKQFVEEQIITK